MGRSADPAMLRFSPTSPSLWCCGLQLLDLYSRASVVSFGASVRNVRFSAIHNHLLKVIRPAGTAAAITTQAQRDLEKTTLRLSANDVEHTQTSDTRHQRYLHVVRERLYLYAVLASRRGRKSIFAKQARKAQYFCRAESPSLSYEIKHTGSAVLWSELCRSLN